MKKRDKDKLQVQKGQITITLPVHLIKILERRADECGSKPSYIVEHLCRRHISGDRAWHSEMAKFYAMLMQQHIFLRDQADNNAELVTNEEIEAMRPPVSKLTAQDLRDEETLTVIFKE